MNTNMFLDYPDILTVAQVRKILGGHTSKQLVYRMLKNGYFIYVKLGKEYRITKASVIAYLTANASFYSEREEKDVK